MMFVSLAGRLLTEQIELQSLIHGVMTLSLFKQQQNGEATLANIEVINYSRRLEIDLRSAAKTFLVWRMLHVSFTVLKIAKEGRKLIVHRSI